MQSHDQLGIPHEFVDNVALKERFPYMEYSTYGPPCPLDSENFGNANGVIDGALVISRAGYVSDTVLATQNLQRAAEALGATFRFRVGATDVLKSGGRVSGLRLTDGSEVSTPVVVNACGPWSSEFNKVAFAGDAPPDDSVVRTRPMRVEVSYPPAPPGLDVETNSCVVTDFDTGVYFRPATGGRICIGSIEPKCDPVNLLDSAEDFVEGFSDPWERQTYRAALRMPSLPIPNTAQGVSHMYDKSDDFTAIYDRTSLRGFYTAIGTSGNQFKNCGVVGQIMAPLIEASENGHDHDEQPLQVPLPITGETLDMSTFSRLRGKGSNMTTHSVLG